MNDTHPLTLVLERTDLAHVRATLDEWEYVLRLYIDKNQVSKLEARQLRDQAYGAFCILTSLRLYGLASKAYKIFSMKGNTLDD